MRIKRMRPYLLVIFGCLMVLALLGITYTHSKLNTQAMEMSAMNKKRIARLDQLRVLMADAEASALSFLLFRKDSYLEPYRSSAEKLPPLLAAMNFDIPEGSEDWDDLMILKRLVGAKFQHMAQLLNAEKVSSFTAFQRGEMGKQLTDEIRIRLSVLKDRQEVAHEALERNFLDRVTAIQYVGYALGLASLQLILSLFFVQQRQVTLRARIHDLLKTENSRLESMVEQRTSELSDLASHLTNARESERQHIARELHDQMGSWLTAAKMDAGWLRRSLGNEAGDKVQERLLRLIESIGNTINLSRRIIDDLQPPLLHGLGLVEALRGLAEQFQIDIPVQIDLPANNVYINAEQSLALYRIAQESLTNIRKYAQASQVHLSFFNTQAEIVLTVRDNGVGFEPSLRRAKAHGIAGMRHRLQMFNGQLILRSAPGQGTYIEARMPLVSVES